MSKNIKNDFLIEITEKDLRNHLLSYSPNPLLLLLCSDYAVIGSYSTWLRRKTF